MLSEIIQTENGKYYITYVESKKHTNQNENRLTDKETKWLPEGRGGWVDETGEGD